VLVELTIGGETTATAWCDPARRRVPRRRGDLVTETEIVVAVLDRLRRAVTRLAEAGAISAFEQNHLANVLNQAIDDALDDALDDDAEAAR
jgi:hypothetical protein